ncbi:hypothetical protein GF312_10880 [Candidatus Poribacteria bacterium]|nr:hypothetical protein [Candidatus Poribacteria bacterium]
MRINYSVPQDTFGRLVDLNEKAIFPFQGIPIEIASNSPTVLEEAEKCFGIWRKLEKNLIENINPIPVKIIVHPADYKTHAKLPFVYRAHGEYFLASSGSNLITIQINPGMAVAFITPEMVEDSGKFHYSVLKSIVKVLITGFDRGPIHAGGVVKNGRTIILLGDSGSGKSTLCYACVKNGFQLLTDEAVFVSIKDGLRLWSGSHHIKLKPDAKENFPEISHITPEIQNSGKLKIILSADYLTEKHLALWGENPIVCILRRDQKKSSRLEKISLEILVKKLCTNIEPAFDLNRNINEIARILARKNIFRFTVGSDLEEAVQLLLSLVTYD